GLDSSNHRRIRLNVKEYLEVGKTYQIQIWNEVSQDDWQILENIEFNVGEVGKYDLKLNKTIIRQDNYGDGFINAKIHNGVVYGIRNDSNSSVKEHYCVVYAFDLYGNQLWKRRLDNVFIGAMGTCWPVFGQDNTIYIQASKYDTTKTLVFALNPDGSIKWQKEIDGERPLKTSPSIIENQLIIGLQNNVYSINIDDPDVINWQYSINNSGLDNDINRYEITYPPIVDDNGNIYLTILGKTNSVKDSKIQVLDRNGNEKWDYISSSRLTEPVIKDNSTLYVADETCMLNALNTDDGNIVHDDPLNGYEITEDSSYRVQSIEIGNDNTLYALLSNQYFYNIIAIAPDGIEKYFYNDKGCSNIVENDGYVYYTVLKGDISGGDTIVAIDPNGRKAAEIPAFGSSTASYKTIYVDGNVLVGARGHDATIVIAKIQKEIKETPASIEILEKNKKFGVYLEETLAVCVKNLDGKAMVGEELEWESSDHSIVEVDEAGRFRCHKKGHVDITVRIKGTNIADTASIEVIEKDPVPFSLEILSEEDEPVDALTVEYKIPYQFKARVKDQYGNIMEDERVSWDSIINFNQCVDENGLFNPKAIGTYTLTVKSVSNNTLTEQIAVTIERKPDIYGGIFPKEIVMTVPGSIKAIPVSQYDEAIEFDSISWTSSNEDVAIIDDEGVITALDYGTTTIAGEIEGIIKNRKVKVVPSFGYEWEREYKDIQKYMEQDNDNTIYFIDEDIMDRLISINPDGNQNWALCVDKYINFVKVGLENNIYCLTKDASQNQYVALIKSQIDSNGKTIGNVEWKTKLDVRGQLIRNIQQASDGTIYVVDDDNTNSRLLAIDSEGGIKWTLEFGPKTVRDFKLDADENIICITGRRDNTSIVNIADEGNKANITNQYEIEGDIWFKVRNGNLQIDSNGVIYGYFQDEDNKFGVCAVEKGAIKWKYYFNDRNVESRYPKLKLSDANILYFTSEFLDNSIVYAIDTQGNEIWKKELKDLVNIENCMYCEGDFTVDSNGNIYLPIIEKEASGWHKNSVRSIIAKIDINGEIIKYISYDIDKYGEFSYIFSNNSNDSVYVIGKIKANGKHLIKFSFRNNNQELKVDDIKITGYKNSIITGDYLNLKADVYSQFGSLMVDEEVIWKSDKEEIAIVDSNGCVSGLKAGKVVITATSVTNPDVKEEYHITVVDSGQYHISMDTINQKTQKVIDYYKKEGIQSDWMAFALGAVGEDINSEVYQSNGKRYIDNLWDRISASDDLGEITEYERTTMAILAAGYDPHNFAGMNLIERIYSYGSLAQGNNAAIWALIALDAANAEVPEGHNYYTQEFLVDYLLEHKAGDGWAYSGNAPDPDMTGMALYALAPYIERSDVKASVDEAVQWLKTAQKENGSFSFSLNNEEEQAVNTESTAQVILGLTAIGIDPQEEDFTRGEGNPVSAMLSNQLPDGSFEHLKGKGSDGLATNQALQALAALKDFYKNGKSTIFYHIPYNSNMSRATLRIEGKNRTILPQTEVTVALGETKLLDAIKEALDQENIDYEADNGQIATIEGEEGWQWIVNKDTKRYTLNTVLEGGEEIIVLDDKIVNPVVTRLRAETTSVEEQEEFTVRLEKYDIAQNNFVPAVDEEITFAGEVKTTDSEGKVTFKATEEGSFYIKAETKNNLIRPIPVQIIVKGTSNPEQNPSGIKHIKIDTVNTSLRLGDKPLLTVKAFDSNNEEVSAGDIVWSSSNENVIKIDNKISGKLITLSEGTATITAALKENYDIRDSITFTVAPNTREVYIRIEGYGHTVLPRTKINVPLFDLTDYLGKASGSSSTPSDGWGVEKFDAPTNAHAVVKALENIGVSYDFQDYGWSIYMSMIDGDREFDHGPMSGWMFKVNDINPPVGSNAVKLNNGDDIIWYYGAYGFNTVYTKLYTEKTLVKVGEEVNIRLDGLGKSVEGSIILVNGSEYKIDDEIIKVGKDGKAVLVFDKEGSYEISAIRYKNGSGKIDIVRPIPVTIRVTDEQEIDEEIPIIKVNGITDNMSVEEENISFSIKVTDNKGEEIIPVVRLNGAEISGINGSYNIKLKEGKNIIEIEAVDDKGNTAISIYKIIYEVLDIPEEIEEALEKVDIPIGNQEELKEDQETVYVLVTEEKMTKEESQELEEELNKNKVAMEGEFDGTKNLQMTDPMGEVKLILLADALKKPVKIRVEERTNNNEASEEVVSSIYEFGPSGIKFEKPIYIRLKVPVANKEASNLALGWFNEETGKWIPVPAVIDPKTGEIIGKTNHFTKFAVVDKTMLPRIYAARIGKEAFKKGEEAKLRLRIMNNDSVDRNVMLIMVLYDKENNISKWTFTSEKIKIGQIKELKTVLTIPKKGEYKVKAMIWDDMESMKALSPVIKVDVE
ncbi:Ig-like domain-containing protein, partial [Paramaledivibacter caminithermalis]